MFPIFTNCFVSSDDSSLFICLSVQLEIEPQDCAGDSNSARPFSPSPTMRNGLNGTTQNATTEREERVQEKWTGQRERERGERTERPAGCLLCLLPLLGGLLSLCSALITTEPRPNGYILVAPSRRFFGSQHRLFVYARKESRETTSRA